MDYKLGLHDSLQNISTPWNFSTDGDAEQLEKELCYFMLQNMGIGLAANQVGMTKQVFVMGGENIPGFPKPFAVFNPRIVFRSDKTVLFKEGCLSFPGLYLNIQRPEKIHVEYQNSRGDMIEAEMDGLIARCFQHEFDHLNGKCFVDIVSPLKLKLALQKLRKQK